MCRIVRTSAASLALAASLLAQAYPVVTVTAEAGGIPFHQPAVASVTSFAGSGSQQTQSLPNGTNAAAGFDLFATLEGSSARSQFSFQAAPLRCAVDTTGLDVSSLHQVLTNVPIRITMTSPHALTGVLRIRQTATGTSNGGTVNILPVGGPPFSPPIPLLSIGHAEGNVERTLAFSIVPGVPTEMRLILGSTTPPGSGTYSWTHGVVVELASAQASYEPNYRPGCPGSAGQVTLAQAGGPPIIPSTFDLDVANLPSGAIAIGLLGFQNLPTDLGVLGAPGCTVATDVASLTLLANTAGSGTWSLAIPNLSALASLGFLQQVLVLDPSANALGVSLSPCGRGVFGT